MSLERPHSRVGWRERGPPPAPPPTYLWEELRRSRSRGGYPWTILDKEPLSDQLDIELLLKGRVQFITVDEDDERLETGSTHERGRHSSRGRKRFRDRNRITRSRSEPTTIGADGPVSGEMDRSLRSPTAASTHSGESEDFSLNDEDIPDFVMAYLQSDKGNLDEDIPDHILEYIQSRAAQLEKNQKYSKQPTPLPADDLFYTEDEMRIINQARRRLEEQGEFGPVDPALNTANDDMNNFDDFFARAESDQQVVQQAPPVEQVEQVEQMEYEGAVAQAPPEEVEPKKGGRFLKNLSIPSKSQLKLKLPKLRSGEKKKSDNIEEDEPVEGKKRKQKQRRPQSSSPIRQKISQQFESWNANLKRVLPRRSQQDGQVKSFVALLPGRSRSRPAKVTHPENQYEEIGKPRDEAELEEKANGSYNFEGEETMEDVENLPESEEVDVAHVNPEIVDREVIDALNHREFVDVDFKDQEKEENQKQEPNAASEKFGAFAARGRQALEMTKTKIQQSKEKLQATGTRLQSTLAKQNFAGNLEATRKKMQSTLSPKNLAATGNKLQSTLTNTLRKRGKGKKSDIISGEPVDQQDEPAVQDSAAPVHESYYDPVEAPTATARRRAKKKESVQLAGDPLCAERGLEPDQECRHVERRNVEPEEEQEEEEEEEEEIEPRMEFSLYQPDKPAPESVDQSTETLPEDVEGEKENAVVRPSRRRFSSKNRTEGARPRPHSVHCESSSVSSAWPGARPKYPVHYPAVSQEILATFATPINALDAVDPWRSVPSKPPRSRSKKDLHTMSDMHLYSNVAPPRRSKKQPSWSTGTWPRKSPSVEYPTAPRRLKPKHKEQVNPSEMQTWPRRRRIAKSPPAAPKRTRSKRKLDGEDAEEELKRRIHDSNILTDPDTLFGAESRYIDEEEMQKKPLPLPDLNQLSEADVLFGPESRFIDDDSSIRSNPAQVTPQPVSETLDVQVTESQLEAMITVEPEMMEEIHQQIIPTLRSRKKSRKSNENLTENTLPRAPSAPLRRKHSIKSQNGEDPYATLSKTRKEPPPVPVPISTPCEDEAAAVPPAEDTDIASAQAGIDKILEILATFPKEQETEVKEEVIEPPQVTAAEDHLQGKDAEESQYSEINHDKRKAPPPRPPPPAYGPESTDSYSYIYTVPRRKKHEKAKPSASPERPPRTYCTIRPHRPPRRTRTVTESTTSSTVALAEQRAPSLSAETRTRSFSVGDKEERDLQSAPVIERMRVRPLPPPPRLKRLQSRSPPPKPPRGQSSTLRRKKDGESLYAQPQPPAQEIAVPVEPSVHEIPVPTEVQAAEEVQERVQQAAQDRVPIVVVTSDGYEPIEEPVTVAEPIADPVEEISVGIQTDPLPEYEVSIAEEPGNETVHCDQTEHHQTVQETGDRSRHLPHGLNNLSFDKLDDEGEDEVKPCEPLTYTNIQQAPVTCDEPECLAEEEAPKISNVEEPAKEAVQEETSPAPVTTPPVEKHEECPKQTEVKECQESKPSDEEVKRPPRRTRYQHEDDDECDSYSRIPASFARLADPIPPLRVELPTRLQLSELEVERLNVREVTADRLIVSSVDTNSLQVCQMATSNASGQLVFNLGPGVTLPPLLLASAPSNESAEEPERPKRSNKSDKEKVQNTKREEAPEETEAVQSAAVINHLEAVPLHASAAPSSVSAPVQMAEVTPMVEATPAPGVVAPVSAQVLGAPTPAPAAVVTTPTQNTTVEPAELSTNMQSTALTSTGVNQTESGEANIGDLALQLAGASARRLGSAALTAASETYTIAQRVAELGWQQLNEHLQRQGIYFDDKERENVKAVLLMLLLVISAIFLLGPGRTRSINHWDFYFPN